MYTRIFHRRLAAVNPPNSEVFVQLPELSDAILARLRERGCGATGVDFKIVAMAPLLECYCYQEGIMSRPIALPPTTSSPIGSQTCRSSST